MKKLLCDDISHTGCQYVAKGDATDDEVIALMRNHGAEAHPDMTANASDEDKENMVKMMHEKIKDE